MYVIGVIPGQVATETLLLEPTGADGFAVADAARGIAKVCRGGEEPRHRAHCGLAEGFGLTRRLVGIFHRP